MKVTEDYLWDSYTTIYSDQIVNGMKGEQFIVDKARLVDGKIDWNGDEMHPNMVFIYEKIAQFKPESVFEGGFGGGQNLYSIQKLFKDIKVGGIELLESQLKFGIDHFQMPKEFFNERPCYFGDFSVIGTETTIKESFDLVYTNAVIMHLNSVKAVNFLTNLLSMRPKYMVLVEGVARPGDEHDWPFYLSHTKILDYYNDLSEKSHPMSKVLVRKDV